MLHTLGIIYSYVACTLVLKTTGPGGLKHSFPL
jgi:hypothetical protein